MDTIIESKALALPTAQLSPARIDLPVHDNRHSHASTLCIAQRNGVETVYVWCELEVFMRGTWKELADGRWEGIDSLSAFTCMFYDFEGVASQ
ncbi:uncharacterized protein ARMOST_15224 [Armillaria ostoyae]|uniref:Uncharacterized protein n=1 Tax=Armillaria ostoyae TaxID=47428 RepID=A0A284RSR9_ARMOS|nr:uncharacterized protein ARMOST_15224 [Armillaria ostoyae]